MTVKANDNTMTSTTNTDGENVIYQNVAFNDELLTIPDGDVVKMGTVLTRDESSGKLLVMPKGGEPHSVLTYDIKQAAGVDVVARVGVAGEFRKQKLIVHGEDMAAFSDADSAKLHDAMRQTGLVAISVRELSTNK